MPNVQKELDRAPSQVDGPRFGPEPALKDRRATRLAARGPMLLRLTFLLVMLGLLWRTCRYAWGMPIWGDEAFVAINFVWRGFAGMLEPLIYGQIVPAGYMWATEAVTRVLGYSEWSLHLVAYLAGLAGLVLFHRFAGQVLPRTAHLLAVGILAGSYFITRHSVEVKPYATDLLIGLSLTMLGWSVWRNPRAVGSWVALIVLAGLAVWCSYPSMFVGGAVGLLLTWLMMRERFRPAILLGWAAYGIVLCGSSLVMYLWYAKPQAAYSSDIFELESWSSTFPPLGEPWRLAVWFFDVHLGNMFAYPQGGAAPGSVLTFALFCIGGWRLWRKNRPLLLLLVAPLVLNFVAAAMRAYPYGGSARVAQHVAPAICLLSGLGLSVVFRRFLAHDGRWKAMVISTIALLIIPVGDMVDVTFRPYKEPKVMRIHETVRSVAERTSPADRWIVFNATEKVPWAPYLGDWRGVGGQFVFDVARFAPVPLSWAPRPESVELSPGQSAWVLVYYAQRRKVDFPREQLKDYLAPFTQRYGEPEHTSVEVELKSDRREAIEIYRYRA